VTRPVINKPTNKKLQY